MADESHCTGLALRFCEQMSQAGCLCKAEKSMKVSGSHVTKLKSFSGTDEGSSQHRSLAPGREGLSGLPHDKKPAQSGSRKGWSNSPPSPMAAPTWGDIQ